MSTLTIRAGPDAVTGELLVPEGAGGLVVFAHGSGSGRHSPRNRFVAERLRAAGLATFLLDLLTPGEERADEAGARLRFDIPFLARRLERAAESARLRPEVRGLPLGYFGASTGAAAALLAAARDPDGTAAVVSRGGRPDLAGAALPHVAAPTLLIVGGEDREVLALNREAARAMRGEVKLAIVPGATHLFEEPGTLEAAAELAAGWFARHLEPGRSHVPR